MDKDIFNVLKSELVKYNINNLNEDLNGIYFIDDNKFITKSPKLCMVGQTSRAVSGVAGSFFDFSLNEFSKVLPFSDTFTGKLLDKLSSQKVVGSCKFLTNKFKNFLDNVERDNKSKMKCRVIFATTALDTDNFALMFLRKEGDYLIGELNGMKVIAVKLPYEEYIHFITDAYYKVKVLNFVNNEIHVEVIEPWNKVRVAVNYSEDNWDPAKTNNKNNLIGFDPKFLYGSNDTTPDDIKVIPKHVDFIKLYTVISIFTSLEIKKLMFCFTENINNTLIIKGRDDSIDLTAFISPYNYIEKDGIRRC